MRRYELLTLPLRRGADPMAARQHAREAAAALGYGTLEQTRTATAVSEIARACMQQGGGVLRIGLELDESGRGEVRYELEWSGGTSPADPRLLDGFELRREQDTIRAETTKRLPRAVPPASVAALRERVSRVLPVSAEAELQERHDELLLVLGDLNRQQEELRRANQELEDTNRGVVALYAELDERAEQLARANRLKDQFISYLSHEFRTPLNSMALLAEMLMQEASGSVTEDQAIQLRLLRKSARDLLEMASDLLDLAKIEAGKITLHVEDVNITELFSALRGMMRPLVPETGVELVLEDTTSLPLLHTDGGKLAQILRNLVSNALKFTERGEVRVRAARAGDGMVFEVRDTGIGIAPEEQQRIFEEFAQVNTPLHRRARGSGLGLALSQRFASLLGGRIELESEPGRGSVFSLHLPQYREPT